MEITTSESAVTIRPTDLESLIRRVVKEAVQEEFTRLFRTPNRSLLEYLVHEGPDDPAGDEQLLAEAMTMIQQYEVNQEGWKTLEEFEAELAETAHELPR
jgi:hypothetical protein